MTKIIENGSKTIQIALCLLIGWWCYKYFPPTQLIIVTGLLLTILLLETAKDKK